MQAGVGPTSLFTHWRTVAVPGAVQFFTRLTGEKKKNKGQPLTKAHGQACMLQDKYCI